MEQGNDINFDLSSSDLTNLQKKNLSKFLKQNQDIFLLTLQTLGRTDLYHHTIETEPEEGPVRLPFYRQAPHIKAETQVLVDEMLEQGIIEPSNSVWHSPVIFYQKER